MNEVKISFSLDRDYYPHLEKEDVPWADYSIPSPMTEFRPNWFKKFKPALDMNGPSNLKTCPSFVNIMKEGFVVRNQADLCVERNNDGFSVTTLLPNHVCSNDDKTPLNEYHVQIHTTDQFPDDFPFPENHFPMSFKFMSPYFYSPHESLEMVILPCWWDEYFDKIKALHGLIHLEKNSYIVFNINTFIKIPEEKLIIPQGTPLCHLLFGNIKSINLEHEKSFLTSKFGRETLKKAGQEHTNDLSVRGLKKWKKYILGGQNDQD